MVGFALKVDSCERCKLIGVGSAQLVEKDIMAVSPELYNFLCVCGGGDSFVGGKLFIIRVSYGASCIAMAHNFTPGHDLFMMFMLLIDQYIW